MYLHCCHLSILSANEWLYSDHKLSKPASFDTASNTFTMHTYWSRMNELLFSSLKYCANDSTGKSLLLKLGAALWLKWQIDIHLDYKSIQCAQQAGTTKYWKKKLLTTVHKNATKTATAFIMLVVYFTITKLELFMLQLIWCLFILMDIIYWWS